MSQESRIYLHPYMAISASAGSGKTYNLVLLILARCLGKDFKKDSIKHILAITFTNKAAAEMKQRILDRLDDLCDINTYKSSGYMGQLLELLQPDEPELNEKEIHHRAVKVRSYILHHYSTLSVSTIDKFNSGLIQSFAHELGLPGKYDLQIDTTPFINQAVDRLLNEIGKDENITRTLRQYIRSRLSTGEKINLRTTLQEKAKELLEDRHYREMKQNERFSTQHYQDIQTQLNEEIYKTAQEIAAIGQEVVNKMQQADIPLNATKALRKNGWGHFFSSLVNFTPKSELIQSLQKTADEEEKLLNAMESDVPKAFSERKEEILDFYHKHKLHQKRQQVIELYIHMRKAKLILEGILPLGVHSDVHHLLLNIEKEQELVFLSRFNTLIQENIAKEHPSFLYEKVGTRYHHFFLDEFQDTSRLQWANLIPLRDDVLSQENSSFTLVGDAKQSIYRFRGGDSDLMGEIISGQENTDTPVTLIHLPANYRSGRTIVNFNNQVYTSIPYLRPSHQVIFGSGAYQNSASDFEGYVQAQWLESNKMDDDWYDALRDDIQKCLEAGYRMSDLCILHKQWEPLSNISQALAQRKVIYKGEEISIPVISEKGLALHNSQVLTTCISWIRCLAFPREKVFRIQFLENLKKLERVDFKDFTIDAKEALRLNDTQDFIFWLKEKYGLNLASGSLDNLSLYNQVLHILRILDTQGEQQDYLLYFLEMVHEYSHGTEPSLQGLVQAWETEIGKTSIQLSESIDAIRMMTIHKSKGLEFPIVFLPFSSLSSKPESGWWEITNQGIPDLSHIYTKIKSTPELIFSYDTELQELYQNLFYNKMIDRLCERYVATTRAVEQMYIYLPEDSRKKMVTSELDADTYLFQYLNEMSGGKPILKMGKMQKEKIRKEKSQDPEIKDYEGVRLRLGIDTNPEMHKKIKVATPSRSYQKKNHQVRTGILLHEILSKIKFRSQTPTVLETYFLKGKITRDERDNLRHQLEILMHNPDYSRYFDPSIGYILTERDYLTASEEKSPSKDYRPDRILDTPDGLILIDFKTGKKESSHQKQIQQYATDLTKLGHQIVETQLIYIS